MALTFRVINRNCYYIHNITKINYGYMKTAPIRTIASGLCYQHNNAHRSICDVKLLSAFTTSRIYSSKYSSNANQTPAEPEKKKLGLLKRFHQMYRDYWYVLLPVHGITSAIWFGSFYYLVRSGVDILSLFEAIGVSETLLSPLRDSSAGYFALAFALYKIVSPLRYAVTIGGTTYAIKKLTAMGVIKPVPSRERIKEMFQEKKVNFQDRLIESKHHYKTQMKEKQNHVLEEMKRYKSGMQNLKNKGKEM